MAQKRRSKILNSPPAHTSSDSSKRQSSNLEVLYDICRLQLITTEQIQQLHFGHLADKTDAPRKLLARLREAGYITRTYTYSRTEKGELVSTPKPVWLMPTAEQNRLRKDLGKLDRIDEFEPFMDYTKSFNKAQSFSDQNLPHEIDITSILIALEEANRRHPELTDMRWVRTSPQHKLTSTKIRIKDDISEKGRTRVINPDLVLYFKWNDKSYFFYIEYERGTADQWKYREQKILPYWRYFAESYDEDEQRKGTRYFSEVAKEFSDIHGLGLNVENALFRVLTIGKDPLHTAKLFVASTVRSHTDLNSHEISYSEMPVPDGLFHFTDKDSFLTNPFGDIWMRKDHLAETVAETVDPTSKHEKTLIESYIEAISSNRAKKIHPAKPTVVTKWLSDTMLKKLPRVSIP